MIGGRVAWELERAPIAIGRSRRGSVGTRPGTPSPTTHYYFQLCLLCLNGLTILNNPACHLWPHVQMLIISTGGALILELLVL